MTSPIKAFRFLPITTEQLQQLLVPILIITIVLIVCVAAFAIYPVDRNSDRMIASIGTEYEAKLFELNSQIDNLKADATQRDQELTSTSRSLEASNRDSQKYRQIIEGAKKNGQAISSLDKKVAALADEMIKSLSEIQSQINKISMDPSSLNLDKEAVS